LVAGVDRMREVYKSCVPDTIGMPPNVSHQSCDKFGSFSQNDFLGDGQNATPLVPRPQSGFSADHSAPVPWASLESTDGLSKPWSGSRKTEQQSSSGKGVRAYVQQTWAKWLDSARQDHANVCPSHDEAAGVVPTCGILSADLHTSRVCTDASGHMGGIGGGVWGRQSSENGLDEMLGASRPVSGRSVRARFSCTSGAQLNVLSHHESEARQHVAEPSGRAGASAVQDGVASGADAVAAHLASRVQGAQNECQQPGQVHSWGGIRHQDSEDGWHESVTARDNVSQTADGNVVHPENRGWGALPAAQEGRVSREDAGTGRWHPSEASQSRRHRADVHMRTMSASAGGSQSALRVRVQTVGREPHHVGQVSPDARFRVDTDDGGEQDGMALDGWSESAATHDLESAVTHEIMGAIAQDLFGGIWTWDSEDAQPERDEAELCSYLYGQVSLRGRISLGIHFATSSAVFGLVC
jgi:hypothetical protein